jgi:hypothetical protein
MRIRQIGVMTPPLQPLGFLRTSRQANLAGGVVGESSRGFGGPNPVDGPWPPSGASPGSYPAPPSTSGRIPPANKNTAGGPAGPFPTPVRPNKAPLILTAVAATAVLAIVGIVIVALMSSGGDSSSGDTEAAEVAQSYLEALSRGDAQAALALGAREPPNSDLLTDEVLRKQLDALPISGIETLGEVKNPEESKDRTTVRIAVRLGDKRTEAKIRMVRAEGRWKLDSSFVDVFTTAAVPGSTASTLVAFGVPVGKTNEFYAFPGHLDLTSSNPYIDVNPSAPLSFDNLGSMENLQPKFSLNEAGRKALEDSVRVQFEPCYAAGPKPAQCSMSSLPLYGYDPDATTFTGPIDVGVLTYGFEGTGTSATVSGTLSNVSVIARRTDGQSEPVAYDISLSWIVDISKDPPVVLTTPSYPSSPPK